MKKVFSVILIFIALLTIACAIEILTDKAWFESNWQPFYNFFLNGATCIAVIARGILNFYPSMNIAKGIHTKRLFFHHYFWGLIVVFIALCYLLVFSPLPILKTFFVYSSDLAVNTGRFLLLVGITLFVDDLPDTSAYVHEALEKLKAKTLKINVVFHWLEILTGIIVLSTVLVSAVFLVNNPQIVSLPTVILHLPMFLSSIISIILFKQKGWLTIN